MEKTHFYHIGKSGFVGFTSQGHQSIRKNCIGPHSAKVKLIPSTLRNVFQNQMYGETASALILYNYLGFTSKHVITHLFNGERKATRIEKSTDDKKNKKGENVG
jgi:hypothetical protein